MESRAILSYLQRSAKSALERVHEPGHDDPRAVSELTAFGLTACIKWIAYGMVCWHLSSLEHGSSSLERKHSEIHKPNLEGERLVSEAKPLRED